MDDLVVRLRECAVATQAAGHPNRARLFREAADELVRLRGYLTGAEEALHGSQGANDELRAEVERLRLQLAWRTERAAEQVGASREPGAVPWTPTPADLAALEVEEGHP